MFSQRRSKETALLLQRPNHLDPRRMAAAFELGGQEGVNDIERQPFAHNAHANRQHVGVVVLPDHAS